MIFEGVATKLEDKLCTLPKIWNGRDAIVEMKDALYPHWRQMEWIGFYFQFICEEHLHDIIDIPGPRYGNADFDGFKEIPIDFKSHAINTSTHTIILNDRDAIYDAIFDYGEVGVILALGNVLYNDDDRAFQAWHEKIKGGKSNYELDRIHRGAWSRVRKVRFDLKQISFISLDDDTIDNCGSFQKGFRNSNGNIRKEKLSLNLENISDELVYFIDF